VDFLMSDFRNFFITPGGTLASRATASLLAVGIALGLSSSIGSGQPADTPEAHRAAARAAAGRDLDHLFARVCPTPAATPAVAAGTGGRGAAPAARQSPPREQWYAEPVKVFDNFYFIGTKEHGAWAINTSDGLIVIDALYDYAVIDEVEAGLKKLGLDPARMKYLVITHGHGDHHGGTKYLQDKYRPKVVMGPADWDLVAKDTRNPRPTRDMAATDNQKITLGDTTITLIITPGHTPSTISLLVPVKDGARTHMAAEWGGTAFSDTSSEATLRSYIGSAVRFRDLATKAGADVLFTNHTLYDRTFEKLAALALRKPGTPHPYVVGTETVRRYLTVAEECAKAELSSRRTQ
jgi:metallo-beta-lactamase class B